MYLTPDKGGSSATQNPNSAPQNNQSNQQNQTPNTAPSPNSQNVVRPPEGARNNVVPFSRKKPNTDTSNQPSPNQNPQNPNPENNSPDPQNPSSSQPATSGPVNQVSNIRANIVNNSGGNLQAEAGVANQQVSRPAAQGVVATQQNSEDSEEQTDEAMEEADKLGSSDIENKDGEQAKLAESETVTSSIDSGPQKAQNDKFIHNEVDLIAPNVSNSSRARQPGSTKTLQVDIGMRRTEKDKPGTTHSVAHQSKGEGKKKENFQNAKQGAKTKISNQNFSDNQVDPSQAQIANQLEKDSPYYASPEDQARFDQEAKQEVDEMGKPFAISPQEEADIQEQSNQEVAELSHELSPEEESQIEQEAQDEASPNTLPDLLSDEEIANKFPDLRYTRLGNSKTGDIVNLDPDGNKLPRGFVPPTKLTPLDKQSVQDKFDQLDDKSKLLQFDLENSKTDEDIEKNKLLSDLTNYKMQQLNDLLKDELKKRALQFITTTVAPLIPWIAGALIGFLLLTGAFFVVLYYYCNYYRNVVTDTAIRVSNVANPLLPDININKICSLFGGGNGGANACPAGTTAYVKDPDGRWVEDTSNDDGGGGSFTSLCLEETLQGKSDNDTIKLWRAQGGVSQIDVPVKVIKEVIAAGKEAGVSSEVVAFVLSKVATESLYASPPLWQARNNIPCYGIVQICAGSRGSYSYESWTRKTLGKVPSPEEFWNNKVMQMRVIATGVAEKKSFRCPYTEGKSVAFDIGVKWLGCVPLNRGDGGVTAGNYGEAVERNFAIITCSGTSTLVQNESTQKNTLSLQNLIKPINTNAQAGAGSGPGSFNVDTAKVTQIKSLISSGKIVDNIVNPGIRGTFAQQVERRQIHPTTVNSVIALANSGVFDAFEISSAYRSDSTTGHGLGIKVDIAMVKYQGVVYRHQNVHSNPTEAGLKAWEIMAQTLSKIGTVTTIISAGPIYQRLVSTNSYRVGGGTTSQVGIVNEPRAHYHHFDVNFDTSAQVGDIAGAGGGSSGSLCCPPDADPNEDESRCFAPGNTTLAGAASGGDVSTEYPSQLTAGEYAVPHFNIYLSAYGYRWGRAHNGIDISGARGPVYAVDAGQVIDVVTGCPDPGGYGSRCGGGFGNRVYIKHSNGDVTRYAHNSRVLVTKNQQVQKGQQIAQSGSSGSSTGPHLHFEHLKGGTRPIDPCTEILRGKCVLNQPVK